MPIRLFTVVSDIMLRLICRRFVFLFLRSLHYVFFFSPCCDRAERRSRPSRSNYFFSNRYKETIKIMSFPIRFFSLFLFFFLGTQCDILRRWSVRLYAVCFPRCWPLTRRKRVLQRPAPRSSRKPISWLRLSWNVHLIIFGKKTLFLKRQPTTNTYWHFPNF